MPPSVFSDTSFCTVTKSASQRRFWYTHIFRFFSEAWRMSSAASSEVGTKGFSTKMCLPALRACCAREKWVSGVVVRTTTSRSASERNGSRVLKCRREG
ncbi:hypothetical protein RRF57_008502 [Xylaria bambusicola]|uniref:Uncharacterized protein n=1 Tax=Xylaria bambusicola TaxID=326684 RepID=A0AAN7UN64_9PEZI